ncbi:ABC transporter ATP-binding protein [Phocaeicola coprocola]|uniref:ABC transporter ATP-binding protein n=1 Tax=Phocaeicola coprocola TaxID=310298 RepID=UPI0015AD3AF0|nr:ABC transporter ATP-binding protein [Phocaeicola coprocola]
MEKIIECENITHYYGKRLIYENLSFEVQKGKVLGLLGKNGTGKTTIINILNGYLKPRSGVCRLFGEEMEQITPQTKARIGLLLEGHVQHTYFNVQQIERFYSRFFPKWKREAYYELLKKLQVLPTQKLSTMSCGQRSQVALGLLFAQDPDLLILDDFSMGLDPGYRRLFVEYLKEYASSENKTVFLTSHIIQDMEILIDDCMIMDYGRLLLHKPVREIMDRFKRFRFTTPKRLDFSSDKEIWNCERLGNNWELYSFLPFREIEQRLVPYQVTGLREENLSLEDVFIGLTGKY